jgi:hypothetical protein
MPAGSDRERGVVEGGARPAGARGLGGDAVAIAAQVRCEGMSCGGDLDQAVTFRAVRRPRPCPEPPVLCPGRVVYLLLNGVRGGGRARADRRATGRDLDRDRAGEHHGRGARCLVSGV